MRYFSYVYILFCILMCISSLYIYCKCFMPLSSLKRGMSKYYLVLNHGSVPNYLYFDLLIYFRQTSIHLALKLIQISILETLHWIFLFWNVPPPPVLWLTLNIIYVVHMSNTQIILCLLSHCSCFVPLFLIQSNSLEWLKDFVL